jgi:hypothetical protein
MQNAKSELRYLKNELSTNMKSSTKECDRHGFQIEEMQSKFSAFENELTKKISDLVNATNKLTRESSIAATNKIAEERDQERMK